MKKFLKKYWLIILSILYLIWPIDLISDVFGPVGLIDDGGLIFVTIVREIVLYFKNKKQIPDK